MPNPDYNNSNVDLALDESSILWLETLGYPVHSETHAALEHAFATEAAKWELSTHVLQELVQEAFVQPAHRVNPPVWLPLEQFAEVPK